MTRHILQRLGQTVIVILGVTVLVFFILRIMPGDPVALMFSGSDDSEFTTMEARREFEAQLGMDRPLPLQYLHFVGELARGDLGTSIRRSEPVTTMIARALPLTIELTLASLVIAIVIAVPVAIVSAMRQNTLFDRGGTALALVGVSLPSFWQGIMLIMIFSVRWPILPVSGVLDLGITLERVTGLPTLDALLTGNWEAVRSLFRHLVLPAITLGTGVAASLVRILRSSLLEIKHQDFVDAFRARGLKERTVMSHMLHNAAPTSVVILGLRIGSLLGGTLVIETVFAYPGMGHLLITSIHMRDFPVVQGVVIVTTLLVIFSNLAADIAHGWLDPRVKLSGKGVA
jgi:dipeptide transport system permease protein